VSRRTDNPPTVSGDLTRMGRGGVLNLAGALTYQVALFVVFTALARAGQVEVGRFTTCFAVLSLLSLLSMAGLRAAMTRFVAVALADRDLGRLRGTLRAGTAVATGASVVVGVTLAVLAPALAGLMDDPALEPGLLVVALTVPAATLTETLLSATQGWRTQRPFTLVGRIAEPLLRCAGALVVLATGGGFVEVLWVGAVTGWLAVLGSAAWLGVQLRRARRTLDRRSPAHDLRAMFAFSAVSWVSALAATGLIWAGTLLLGLLTTQHDVGTFSVATRLVGLAVFVMAPINATFTPHMAHLHHTGDQDGAARAYGSATRWILLLSAPAFVLLAVLPGDLLAFFGPGYEAAAALTVVLVVGQLVSAAAGPCGTVLTMSGRVVLTMADNVAVLVLDVVLTLLLVPRLGVLGAALAWSTSLVLVNVAKLLQVRHVVGLAPAGARWGSVLVASLPAAGAALLVRALTDGPLAAALVGGPAVAVVYLAALLLVGIDDEDRAVLASLLPAAARGRHARRPGGDGRTGRGDVSGRPDHRRAGRIP